MRARVNHTRIDPNLQRTLYEAIPNLELTAHAEDGIALPLKHKLITISTHTDINTADITISSDGRTATVDITLDTTSDLPPYLEDDVRTAVNHVETDEDTDEVRYNLIVSFQGRADGENRLVAGDVVLTDWPGADNPEYAAVVWTAFDDTDFGAVRLSETPLSVQVASRVVSEHYATICYGSVIETWRNNEVV